MKYILAIFFILPPSAEGKRLQSLENLVATAQTLQEEKKAASKENLPEIQKKLDQTLDKIDQEGEKASSDKSIQVDVAQAFLEVSEPARALNRADKAVALAPADPQARIVRAQSYYKLGRYEDAAADAKLALELDPRNAQAQAVLSLSAGRASGRKGAATASGSSGTSGAAVGAAGAAASAASSAGASRIAASQEQADRLKAADYFGQAAGRLGLGDRRAAISLLDKAIALDPKSFQYYLARAKAKIESGEKSQAASAVFDAEQASALAPKSSVARLLYARAQETAGFPKGQVLAAYKAAAELDPSLSADYQNALARWAGGAASSPDVGSSRDDRAATIDPHEYDGRQASSEPSGHLPDPITKALPWATVVLIAAGVGWFWLARKSAA